VELASAVTAAEPPAWPQFRGPAGSGVAALGAKPPTRIGPDTNVNWKVAVPAGASSPVIAGDGLVLTGFEEGKLFTLAWRRADGRVSLIRGLGEAGPRLCLDVATGAGVSEADRPGYKASWGSACVWDTPAGKQVVVAGGLRLKGYDLKPGADLWTVTGLPS